MVDQYLILFYRLTGHAGVDFVLGTFILACVSLLLGKGSVFVAAKITRKHLAAKAAEAQKYQNLSMDALKAGDKDAYQAANQLANEAFGHSFFQQAALSAAFLWPVCFALAWMQTRFLEVEVPIPGTSWSLGYIGVFILLYVLAYFLLNTTQKRLLDLRRMRTHPDTVPT